MRHLLLLLLPFIFTACNPNLTKVGEEEGDLVKYFKITSTNSPDSLGEGYLIIAHAGQKRLLTYYMKHNNGFSHTDITVDKALDSSVTSLHSRTEGCKLNPDHNQYDFMNGLVIQGIFKEYKLESTTVEVMMPHLRSIQC